MRRLLPVLVLLVAACGGRTVSSTTSVPIDLGVLTQEWGCGFGFWLSDPGQTAALRISYLDTEAASRGEVPARVELPDPGWQAEVVVGRDLFANWCDDVVEPDEPEPVVHETWPIVSGTLEIDPPPPSGFCTGGPVTAQASRLVAEAPGGEVHLGDLAITNTAWGCFAG